jgi:hypothetical protein
MKVSMNHNKMDEKKGPKSNVRSSFMIGGLPPKRQNVPPISFQKNFKVWKKH